MRTHRLSRRPLLGAASLLLMSLPACIADSLEALDTALGGGDTVDKPCSGADASSAGCPKDPPPHGAVCGDGVIDGAEQCDDGNPHDGDGCNGDCTFGTVAFAFSGTVVRLGDSPGTDEDPLETGVKVGDPIRGVYRFNPHNVADQIYYSFSSESRYSFHNTPGSFEMETQIGPLRVTSIHVPPMQVDSEDQWYSFGSVFAVRDAATGAPYDVVDGYRLDVYHNAVAGLRLDRPLVLVWLSIELDAIRTPSALTSTALPTTPPELGRFDRNKLIRLQIMTDLGVKSHILGELTSLTLAPGD